MFFDDVRVPVANRVGEEDKGWTYAKYLLEFERGASISGRRGCAVALDEMKSLVARRERDGLAIDEADKSTFGSRRSRSTSMRSR